MRVALSRGQIGKVRGGCQLDISVKSATGWARAFAPTWEMVAGHKGGTMGDLEYRELYGAILDKAEAAFHELYALGETGGGGVKLLCYCQSGRFCHTHLLIDHAVRRFPQWFSDGRRSAREIRPTAKGGRMRHLLAIDLETTGLRPDYHEITQIAAIMLDRNLNELGSFETLVRISHPERGLEGNFNVFEYTGLKLEDIQNGLPPRDALRALETFARSKIGGTDLKHIIMFGQNPTFDKGFLEAAFTAQGWKWPFDFHVLALESMFIHAQLLKTGELPADIGLKDVCKVAGVVNRQKHNAASDIRATVDALHKLCPPKPAKTAKPEAEHPEVLREVFDFDPEGKESPKPLPRRRNVTRK